MYDQRSEPSARKFLSGSAIGVAISILIFACAGFIIVRPEALLQIILFLPDRLGLVQKITPENTLVFDASGTYTLSELQEGDYLILFTGFTPLPDVRLYRENGSAAGNLQPFSIVIDPYSQPDSATYLTGEPLYRFSVDGQQHYKLNLQTSRGTSIAIQPDIAAYNGRVLIGALFVQTMVPGLAFFAFYRRRGREKRRGDKKRRQVDRDKFDDWWDGLKKPDGDETE